MTNLIAKLARLFGIGTEHEKKRYCAFKAMTDANLELRRRTNPNAEMLDPEEELTKLVSLARGDDLPEIRP